MTSRLRCTPVPPAMLSVGQRAEMLALMEHCYDGIDPARFHADLDAKDHVLLMKAPGSDAIRGFSTIRLAEEELDGRKVDILFSGDTAIHPDCWGSRALHAGFIAYGLRRWIRRPWRPLYWLLLSKGFRTYLLMVNNFSEAVPRHDLPADPGMMALRDRVAHAWWGERFDGRRGVVSFQGQRDRVKAHVAPPDARAMSNPHVRWFLANNPGHVQGDEMVCLARLRGKDLPRTFMKILARRMESDRKTQSGAPAQEVTQSMPAPGP